ncbi:MULTISPECIES: ArsR/SmtB family transcription factor [Pseudomonadota]|jgi:ArsR family transcriptional regulator|nr:MULTISPECIES: metalloregulator ArsR/SmtB family transcription factor [Pseudomonadota]MBP7655307.1 ArsR family transcriptional regulator [Pseudoxanthomonas sp.]MDR7070919.1 ArsR family transcriptional regulator [Pseudoxanthomonas japonensis]OCX15374.1 ArsR family transcriptional regulator [Stutzerimonas xanthomarina]OZA58884.1 MAG: ArsR family transcriptional regulator [Acidovorax sp. 17-64-282]HEC5273845.1 ArsR family transcriptional regulator [Enterobacter cloacae]HQS20256.1 metalloregula
MLSTSSESPKHVVFENLAAVAQALGHAHRLELLEGMAQGPRSVEDLAGLVGLSMANASRHLQLLRRARLVEAERQGKRVFYRLAGDVEVVALLKALGRVGERNIAEVRGVMRDFFHDRDALEAVSREELAERLNAGQVTVLDVRPEAEYALGHVAGAINIPADELERRLADLPKGHEIIAYCRGPYCVMSFEAVAALRAKGFKVRRLEDGFPEWKAAGLAVEA